jgi:hypothetical protein
MTSRYYGRSRYSDAEARHAPVPAFIARPQAAPNLAVHEP